MKLYHATYKQNLPSIEQLGLITGQPANFEGMSMNNAIYFALYPEAAICYLESSDTYEDQEIVVLSVELDSLDPRKIYYDWNNKCESTEEINSIAYGAGVPFELLVMETEASLKDVEEKHISDFKDTEMHEIILDTFEFDMLN